MLRTASAKEVSKQYVVCFNMGCHVFILMLKLVSLVLHDCSVPVLPYDPEHLLGSSTNQHPQCRRCWR